jgi:hypothetical protein
MSMSDWSKVTRPIPVPNEWTKPFWEAARRGALELQRCQKCGHFQHPPYPTCVNCMSIDLKFEPVRGEGAIYAYTIMYHTGDKRFAAAVPYAASSWADTRPGATAGNCWRRPTRKRRWGGVVVFEPLNDGASLPQFGWRAGNRNRHVEHRCKVPSAAYSQSHRSADIPGRARGRSGGADRGCPVGHRRPGDLSDCRPPDTRWSMASPSCRSTA